MTFLAALGVNVGNTLLDYPQHAEPWLSCLNRQVREELEQWDQEPN